MNKRYYSLDLLKFDEINENRINSFNNYYEKLKPLQDKGFIELPIIPDNCKHNGHMFYILVKDLDERNRLQTYLRGHGIGSAFHYVPLHSSPEGLKVGRFVSNDENTTKVFERLLRLPMYFNLSLEDINEVCIAIKEFYNQNV